ncbi:NUDIX domain-containing protein [Actinokineospora globicatena]|uniref:NUDIX domain-containing protein n=1 Tax=Actinokineospora globicatena TaxID=103729 RepID=UPI0020A3BC8B|nr:NUDIX domain-containing protein [Actinokineospora globicatena]MCP2305339.1 ADP-ribose pyrophosphatase YjhB, NUDIX family [Actinokineospora globicatena]GLW80816.1 NUDIX hydrolase [Actinokineospora globicatena]GLW87643.1 NUDIX hydrolase [Actinokineospora globicatena]
MRNSHCSFCGTRFPDGLSWPRRCEHCTQTSYLNPIPVAVLLLPVDDGLLVVRRDIEPKELALPGGFVDYGESWQVAAARELREEAGVTVDAGQITLFDALSAPDGTLLVFGLAPATTESALPPSAPTNETTGWELVRGPVPLAFPLHTQVIQTYFDRR